MQWMVRLVRRLVCGRSMAGVFDFMAAAFGLILGDFDSGGIPFPCPQRSILWRLYPVGKAFDSTAAVFNSMAAASYFMDGRSIVGAFDNRSI